MNANARAQELIDLSHSMVQVMATETEALRQGNVSEIEPLQVQKESLAGIYEAHMREVAAEPGLFNSIEPDLKDALTAAAQQMESTVTENKNAVQAALELNTRLVQVIADAVTKSAASPAGYTNTGAAAGQPKKMAQPAAATLNRSF